jgi:hypothetical protein
MCGTPNRGSPFGHVGDARRLIGLLTSVALNYVPAAAPFGSAILFLLNRSKKLTPTLEQMNPASAFISRLNADAEPPIPYTVLAGDIDAFEAGDDGLFARLLTKVGKGFAFETLFGTAHHDVAVRVDSIRDVSHATNIDVPCHHLNYFTSEAGLQALATLVRAHTAE